MQTQESSAALHSGTIQTERGVAQLGSAGALGVPVATSQAPVIPTVSLSQRLKASDGE